MPIGNYKRIKEYDKTKCFYCGIPEDKAIMHNDHYPPKLRKYQFPAFDHVTIRSCRECNYRLGNSMQATLEERKLVAQGADWDKYEITGVFDNQL